MAVSSVSRPASVPWYRLLTPRVLSAAAIVIGWTGIYFAFRGHWLGLVLPLVTTGLALTALRQGDELARRRSAALREALEAAAARNRELDRLRVSVADSGIGITPEDIPKLFQEFSQVDSSLSRQAQGTGLGLALSRKFVELHGGAIGAESIPEKGSTFWFMLPTEGPLRRPPVLLEPA